MDAMAKVGAGGTAATHENIFSLAKLLSALAKVARAGFHEN
jgi:hypothetical protein